jgi:hypothetical protein
MGLGNILKSVALPLASSFFLGPTAGKGLGALFGGKAMNPMIANALVSGGLGLLTGQKPKNALRSALVGGLGGTALQNMFPGMGKSEQLSVFPSSRNGEILIDRQMDADGTMARVLKGNQNVESSSTFEPKTFSGTLMDKMGYGDSFMGSLLNHPMGEGLAAGLLTMLLSPDEEEDERTGFERRPFGAGGPGGQIGGIQYAAMGGPAMPQQISKPGFPRRDGAIMPYEGGGRVDDVPAMLTAGEFVLTKDAVKGLGGGNQSVGIQRAYDMMGDLERRV